MLNLCGFAPVEYVSTFAMFYKTKPLGPQHLAADWNAGWTSIICKPYQAMLLPIPYSRMTEAKAVTQTIPREGQEVAKT